MDLVFIEQLNVCTTIGVYDWEQAIQQKLSLDLVMAHDNRQAAATDDVQYALNYAEVSERILSYVQNGRFLLIERVAEEIANLIQTEFGVSWVKVTVRKPTAVPQASSVGVTIERGQR